MWATRVGSLVLLLLAVCGAEAAAREAPLVEAAKRADAGVVRALLQRGANVDSSEVDGTTALHWAAYRNDVAMVDVLIHSGADVKVANRYGMTALMLACERGNAAIVERLLAAGADPNTMLPLGETALMTAARTGNVAAVKALLARGADVHATEPVRGQTALMWAAAENHAAVVEMLIAAGADVHARSTGALATRQRRFTPLLFAARSGAVEAAHALVAAGADVNETLPDGMSALVLAVFNAQYDVAAFLLDHGANPNSAAQGWTALHQVVLTRRPSTNINPWPLSHSRMDALTFVKKLLESGADPNARMTKAPELDYVGHANLTWLGASPFLLASFRLDIPVMRLLLAGGADPRLPNNDGTTPLMAAAGVGFWAEGENPFMPAEALEGVKLCLELGADVTAADANGDTALHGAAFRGVNAVVELLVAKGAKLEVKNKMRRDRNGMTRLLIGGWTPWHIASGVELNFGLKQKLETAALLRRLMEERGLWSREFASYEEEIARKNAAATPKQP